MTQYLHYIDIVLEAIGAIGLACTVLSRLPLGRASKVLAELGTNFDRAAKACKPEPQPVKHIVIPGGDS